jgi:2',3'-cyclic-nucleotide 2'-phosphodiesterase (5'-nucleotidase family)
MNQVIGFSKDNFEIQRPSSSLMNWCADAIFANQTKKIKLAQPIFCLLNTGGLRSTIGKGTVSLGDIYKLMPFDNTIVWVELPISSIAEIEKYLSQSGGEPIANAKLENGKLLINGNNEKMTHFWLLTSDYLMNGGDKMSFFEQRTNAIMNGKLLRNAFIEEVKSQDTLIFNEELRIK